ncbi:MAG TPA: galactose mutarotase [Halanaerobiaceae bacterium]|jgi:aldose 1-epimerase|nr:aldose epimerase family protein [Bacillota bacterium]HHU93450.1 galactose mutarotase [Halanaerobiaceae bacterium]HOA39991.1 aldose epimerase family protein [Halanaerobiales bacterium]HPZ62067.1 aldose epimerase family protein [Halanaerobiales bacterium]HQD03436.1 aldose epimerase family protein [Halanaerobiales bacterium]
MKNHEVSVESFGFLPEGKEVFQYRLKNKNGLELTVINYGGIIKNLFLPDRDGEFADIVLGYDNLESYLGDSPFFGALIGRFGNRIANGRFVLDGQEYELALNDKPGGIPCHLHGGNQGFDKVYWDIEPVDRDDAVGLKLSYLSRDGEEGYPGNLQVTVFYYLTDDNVLRVEYYAETDKATPVNLTQHSYFNLKGSGKGDILEHELSINAAKYTPVNEGLIPTGELESVEGTPFDFRSPKTIGRDINIENQQLGYGNGFDHNYVLDGKAGELRQVAQAYEPESGRILDLWTTEPGMQFYSGNSIGEHTGKNGDRYGKHSGFCLETQHYPDSPNQDRFPSTILRPGDKYESITEFRFKVK